MTLAEAWRELGVEPGADSETVRRAYLRLVKTRKPEQDPVGFQRLRDAYEIARAGGVFEAMVVARTRPDRPAPPAPASTETPAASEPHASATAAQGTFENFAHEWSRAPPADDLGQRLEIARRAIAALPDDPRTHWLLASSLSRTDEAALADALRKAWRKGWPEFLEALLVRLPDRAGRDEVDAAFASDRATLRLAAASVAARWASRRAAAVVVDMCRTATEGTGDAKGDRVRALPLAQMLEVVLALHWAGALDPAAEAQAALRACLHDSGLELALLRGPLGRVWTLTEEIDGLPADFPQPLRAAFARATRAGDLATAYGETLIVIASNRPVVEGWVGQLGESAANVTATMRAALAYVPAVVKPPPFSLLRLLYCFLPAVLGLAIIIGLARLLTPKDPPPPLHDIDGFYKGPPKPAQGR